jgi:hypothetical protein
VHVPCSEETSIADTASAGFYWTFHYTPLVLYQQSPGMVQKQ